jgi:hypothetical protein
MLHHWHFPSVRTILLTILVTIGTATPALAAPAPLVGGRGSGGDGSTAPATSSTDLTTWVSMGIGAAGTLVVVLAAFALTLLVRRTHQRAPHPA